MGAPQIIPYRCAGCGKPAVGRIKPCDCPTRVGFRDGEPSVWLYDNKADAEIASLGLDPDTVATVRSGLTKAGYVILSPDEVREMERDRQAVEFAARWCWRTDPPHANSKLTDAERLSAIKYYPTIKKEGQPHIDLAEREAIKTEARENYQRHVEEVNRATDAEIGASIRSMKGGRDA